MAGEAGSGRRPLIVRGLVLFVLYMAGARLGLALSFSQDHVSAIWPPRGIAVAALMIWGTQLWPAVFAGALASNVLDGVAVPAAIGIAAGSTVAPLIAVWLMRKLDVRRSLERLRDVVWLAAGGGLAAMTISATVGSLMLVAAGTPFTADLWRLWWVGDAMGVIIVAPIFMTLLSTPLRSTLLLVRWKTTIFAFAAFAAVTMSAVFGESPAGYLVIPLALLIALRLEQPGAAAAVLVMSVIDIWGAITISQSEIPIEQRLMALQGANATIAVILLSLGAVTHERRRAQEELKAAAANLEIGVRQRTEQLRASEERLAQAQRIAHIGSFEWNARSDSSDWSEELYAIYGLDPGDKPPGFEDYLVFVREDRRDEVRAHVEQGVREEDSLGHEYPIVLRNGTHKWVHAYIEVRRDDQGELIGLRGTCQDITERKRAENALRSSEQRFRTLLESAPDAVVVVDQHGTIVQVNEETTNLLGYARDELLGMNVDVLVPDDLRGVHEAHRARYAASPQRRTMGAGAELSARHKDGSLVPVDISLSPVETDSGFFVFALMRNASERRHVEDALRTALEREQQATEDLRKLNDAKNAFLSAVSHELRTPLTAILGFAELLQDEAIRSSGDLTTDLIDRLASSATRLSDLLGDILDIDRLTRGVIEPLRRPMSLYRIIDHALEALDTSTHPLTLDVQEATVVVDPAQTERIVENLVTNAIKYTPGETPIVLRAHGTPNAGLMLVVEDEGPGIPKDIGDTIFDPFVRGSSGELYSQGTGIGLALVNRFAQLHGGSAWVEERNGGGAAFHVYLAGPHTPREQVA